jgi:uracil-DNA glycosylase
MMHEFDPGYVCEPFISLCRTYPGSDVYPAEHFRVEWGPIFHRGRLDGSARILAIGQDPGQHENVARRILVGEAGQRVQGFLARLGLTSSYVMINAFLYSVFGSGGFAHSDDPGVVGYRNRWFNSLLVDSNVTAVVAFGRLADAAFEIWRRTELGSKTNVTYQRAVHPTFPESASAAGTVTRPEAMAEMLHSWNEALDGLRPAITAPDEPGNLAPYGTDLVPGDLAPIPERDVPAGLPPWMRSLSAWATRRGDTTEAKRATISITVPVEERPWEPLP